MSKLPRDLVLTRTAAKIGSKIIQKYVDKSEQASHGFLGESTQGENNKDHSLIQRVAAHALGYATAPLLAGMEQVVANLGSKGKRSVHKEQTVDKQPSMPPKSKTDGKKRRPRTRKGKVKTRKGGLPRFKPLPTRNRKPQTVSLSGQGQQESKIEAPVTYGAIGSSGLRMDFNRGPRSGCLKITGSLYLGDLCASTSGTTTFATFAPKGVLTELINGWMVCPQNYYYFGAPVTILTQLFERYLAKTRLSYRPRVSTAVAGNFKILYTSDPMTMWALTGKDHTTEATPALALPNAFTTGEFAGFPHVFEGSVWAAWKTGWSHRFSADDMNYTTATTYTTAINPGTTAQIDVRQAIAGFWCFSGSGLPSQGDTKTASIGELWVDYELDLCDLVTTAYQEAPSSSRSLQSLVSNHQVISAPVLKRTVNSLDAMAAYMLPRLKAELTRKQESKTRTASRERDSAGSLD